jgi:hypothetical protein
MEKLIDWSSVKFHHRFEVTLLMLKGMIAWRLNGFTFRHGGRQFHKLKLVPMTNENQIHNLWMLLVLMIYSSEGK